MPFIVRDYFRLQHILFSCFFAIFFMPAAVAQTMLTQIAANDPRPVAEAIRMLADRHPAIITYEDPRYIYSEDIRDVTERSPRGPGSHANKVFMPRGGLLQFSYDVSELTGNPIKLANLTESIVNTANTTLPGGRFDVLQTDGIFHIVPIEVRDKEGRWKEQASILDTRITMSTEELDGYALVKALLEKIGEANDIDVWFGALNLQGFFFRHTGRIVANDEPARDVLMRTLHDVNKRFTFLMLFDPTFRVYVLNVAMVAEPQPDISSTPSDVSPITDPSGPGPSEAVE